MELFAEAVSVVGAMVLSVACGLLMEELLFGGLVRLFFSAHKPGSTRSLAAADELRSGQAPGTLNTTTFAKD